MSELTGLSVGELRRRIRGGEIDVADLLQATLSAIDAAESGDPPLRAFLSVSDAASSRGLEAILSAPAGGDDPGPLAGIPVAVKDNICVRGLPTTCGSRMLEDYVTPYEATVVRKLRSAGALIVGKTNLDEFAMGSSTENSAFGPTRNPWDHERVPGGSSGGSAAAVSAKLVPVALGSDTGGSIRQPASFCGCVGVKPSYGRVSRYGLVAFASSLEGIGPMARTVEDAAILLNVIAGPDPLDSTCVNQPPPDFTAGLDRGADGLVVGLPREYLIGDLDPQIARLVRAAAERLAGAGAEIREVSLPHTRYAIPTYYLIANAEASSNLARYDGIRYGLRAAGAESAEATYRRTRGRGFGREVKRRIVLGTYGLSAGYYEAYYGRGQRVRRLIEADFDDAFADGVDALLTPTAPTVAFPLGERVDDPVRMYLSDVFTVPASLARVPAMSVPIGRIDGLPVGGQIIAGLFQEGTMLRVARALERTLETAPLDADVDP